jgi:hypothetical protein
MTTEATTFNSDDLEPTDLGIVGDVPREPNGRRSRAKGPTQVKPDDVIDVGNTTGTRQVNKGGRKTKEQEEEAKRTKAQARRDEATAKVRNILDSKVDPVLATVGRMALQVPERVAWMSVDQDPETGDVLLNAQGAPHYHYYNGAQMLVLHPLEKELICMMAPSVMEFEASEKAKEFAKKATPYVVGGGFLLLVAHYGLRLAQVKRQMTPLLAAASRATVVENEQAQGEATPTV